MQRPKLTRCATCLRSDIRRAVRAPDLFFPSELPFCCLRAARAADFLRIRFQSSRPSPEAISRGRLPCRCASAGCGRDLDICQILAGHRRDLTLPTNSLDGGHLLLRKHSVRWPNALVAAIVSYGRVLKVFAHSRRSIQPARKSWRHQRIGSAAFIQRAAQTPLPAAFVEGRVFSRSSENPEGLTVTMLMSRSFISCRLPRISSHRWRRRSFFAEDPVNAYSTPSDNQAIGRP